MPTKPLSANDKVTRFDRILYYRLFYVIAGSVALVDRFSKWVIQKTLDYGTYDVASMIEVIPGFFYICHIGNKGAAWGILHGKTFLLSIFSLIALALLYCFRKSLGMRELFVQISLGLVTGGILGNLYDRIVLKHVVDFVDLHFGSYRYPAFNVADSCILIGVLLFCYYSFKEEAERKQAEEG